MRRGVPNRKAINGGEIDIGTEPHRYLESLKNSVDLADIEPLQSVDDSTTLAELLTAIQAFCEKANGT